MGNETPLLETCKLCLGTRGYSCPCSYPHRHSVGDSHECSREWREVVDGRLACFTLLSYFLKLFGKTHSH
jgi:hypothetical protein